MKDRLVASGLVALAASMVILAALCALVGCSKDSTDVNLPGPKPQAGIVCRDKAGLGPDITLDPPRIQQQLKDIDGCFRGGKCFYNCGKFEGK